jgi:hypothetical protein
MNLTLRVLLCFFLALPLSSLSSQVIPPDWLPHRKGRMAKQDQAGGGASSLFTLNLPSLTASALSLRFEQKLGRRLSVGVGGGYLLSNLIPAFTSPANIPSTGEVGLSFDEGGFSGFNATPELRLYPFSKRGAPYGFYLSLFGRYFNYDWDIPYVEVDLMGDPLSTANGEINISGIGGGMALGVQFIIKDRIVIDWALVGGGVASTTFTGRFSSPDITDDMAYYQGISDDLRGYFGSFPLADDNNLSVEVQNSQASLEVSGQLWPILRPLLAIGVAF